MPTDNTSVIKKDNGTKPAHASQDPSQGHKTDIQFYTPKGEKVLWHDVIRERNPYAEACQDCTDLLGIVPGHYHLQATHTAKALCVLMQTNLHSQFYKSAPKIVIKVLGYSLGRNRVTKNQACSATRLQVLEAKNEEVNAAVSSSGSTPTLRPTHSPEQGESTAEEEADEDETTHDPIDKRIEVPPRDSSLFYSNGNAKPLSTGRQPIREPESRRAGKQNAHTEGARGEGKADFMGDPLTISENQAPATGRAIARAGLARQTYPPRSLANQALAMGQILA